MCAHYAVTEADSRALSVHHRRPPDTPRTIRSYLPKAGFITCIRLRVRGFLYRLLIPPPTGLGRIPRTARSGHRFPQLIYCGCYQLLTF